VVQTYVEGSFMIRTPMEGDDYGGEKGKDDWQPRHEEISKGH
jgi:hypothetical protein